MAHLDRVLAALVERLQQASPVQFNLRLDQTVAALLTDEQAVQLANIAREAMSNSLRHGEPKQIEIRLIREDEFIVMEVRDDGCGFDSAHPGKTGMGLRNMAARASEAGGTFTIHSTPANGTQITVSAFREKAEKRTDEI